MKKRDEYLEMLKRQRKEVEDFPIAYAFNDKQLEEALEKLGATKEECITICGHGDIVKRTDANRFVNMLKGHTEELKQKLKDDLEFAEAAFLYEMDNHEYSINWDGDSDVLACFGLTYAELDELGLELVYQRAVRQHLKHAEEWGMI